MLLDVSAFIASQSEDVQKTPGSEAENQSSDDDSDHDSPSPLRSSVEATLGSPYTQRDREHGLTTPELSSLGGLDGLSSPANVAASRKRPGEDIDNFVQRVVQRLKLKKDTAQALTKFTAVCDVDSFSNTIVVDAYQQLSPLQREVTLLATVLQSQEILQQVQPAEAAWSVPKRLHVMILLLSCMTSLIFVVFRTRSNSCQLMFFFVRYCLHTLSSPRRYFS